MARNTEPSTGLARRGESGVTRWSPWDEMTDLRHRMDELFSRAFGYTPLSHLIPADAGEFEPPVDIHEADDRFVAHLSLPGYVTKDINLEATPNAIQIAGERKTLYDDDKAVPHRKSGVSNSGSFRFTYELPSEIDPNKVKATFSNGVLHVEMPKTERARSKGVKVNITE
jgi:HSP20 family protein